MKNEEVISKSVIKLNEKIQKLKSLLLLINKCKNIGELSELSNIPRSSIQRYLTDEELMKCLGIDETEKKKIRDWLDNAKLDGLSRGGKKSQINNGFSKDSYGKFTGPKRG